MCSVTYRGYKYNPKGIRMSNAIIEIIPIVLAIVAIYLASGRLTQLRRTQDRISNIIGIIASIILIVAQSSWYASAVVDGTLQGTWFANQLWTAFNSLVMLLMIISSYPRSKN